MLFFVMMCTGIIYCVAYCTCSIRLGLAGGP